MKDGQWEDWTEPLKVLLAKAEEFLEQIDFSNFPRGGILIEPPELYIRKEQLAEAFDAYIANILVGDFLEFYVYASSVFEDMYGFVFEYIGENEHQMDLHDGDEFAHDETSLLEDFCLYMANWQSPIAAASEKYVKDKQ